MILKEIKLKTFKCFENYSVSFDKINLIEGAIGIGKSTILEALIFALYGFTNASLLSDLPTRGVAEKCKVTALIEENSHLIEITREYPLKLTIKEDGKTLKLSTSEGNNYLVDMFGTRINFSIFRVLDAYSKEANFLEEGTVTLKKILFAGTDEMFNSVRNNLNAIKLERERFNRDTTVVYKCYPSEKRLQVLTTNLVDISNSLVIANQEISDSEKELKTKEIKITSNKGSIESLTRQIDGIDSLRSSFDTKLNDTESSISLYNTKIENYKKQIENISELRSSFDTELYQKESRHSEVPKVLEDINKQIKNIDTLKSSFDNKLKETENKIEQNRISIKTYEQKCEELSKQEIEIIETNVCYVCKQPLKNNSAGDIVKARMNERAEYMIKINTLDAEIINLQDQTKILREKIILERNTKLEEYKKEIDNLRNEDIEICSRIPVLKNAIIKEREEKRKEFLSAIENYENIIIKSKEEIEGLKQAIITEKEQMIEKCKNDRENLITDNAYLADDMTNADEILVQDKEARDKLTPKKERIQACKMKLEARLKQKEYIYTEKDIIIVKKAIEELDKLSSVYLVETVHSLEPIINSVLEKIGFEITFDVDIKGKFNILLGKEDVQYKYKDLSCGQRLILQIALKIALLLQQSKTGLMISDEGLSALENDNLEDIINLFKDLQFQLVFVLHRASIEDPEVNIIKLGGTYGKTKEE